MSDSWIALRVNSQENPPGPPPSPSGASNDRERKSETQPVITPKRASREKTPEPAGR